NRTAGPCNYRGDAITGIGQEQPEFLQPASERCCAPHELRATGGLSPDARRAATADAGAPALNVSAAPATHYQITTPLSPALPAGSVSLQPNAAATAGRFAGAPLARPCAGECGSDTSRTLAASGRMLERHAEAQP